MAQKRDGVLTVQAMPWRDGLSTAGQQTTVPETALWKAEDTTAMLDGLLTKRPGTRRWGQILTKPNTGSSTIEFYESWSETSNWTETDNSSSLISTTKRLGSLRTTVLAGTSNENLLWTYTGDDASASTEWSLRILLRIIGAPTYDDTTNANTLAIRVASGSSTRHEFAVFSDGLYYKQASDNKYVMISGTDDLANGGWHALEIRCDTAGSTAVLLDEETVSGSGIADASLADVGSNDQKYIQLRWEVDGDSSVQYSTEIGEVQYIDTATDPFAELSIDAVADFSYINNAGSPQSVLVAAAGDNVYHDRGLQGAWRVMLPADYGNTFFTQFRRTLLVSNYSDNVPSVVWQWNGTDDPETLSDAPNLKFMTEHKQRVWGAGDRRNPLRLYYSGDRQPNLWFSPDPDNVEDQVDAVEQAGYLEIPAKKGDEITALFGDYYGRLLVFTRRGVWQISGDGPASFSLASVSQDVGAENADCVAQVGNDIWFLGRYGVQSLSATNQFGDIQANFPSAPIGDLWTQSTSTVNKIVKSQLSTARLKYNPTQGLVYCAVAITGQTKPESIYVFNVNVGRWYGPWNIPSTAMENIEIGLPLIEVMAHGGTDGQILYTDQGSRRDVSAGYTMKLQSAYLNGRSLDKRLPGMMKTWRRLRLFVLPRGNWTMDLTWKTDAGKVSDTQSVNQNQYKTYVLGDTADDGTGDFRLDIDPDGRLHSLEEMAVIEVRLDSRGYSLQFTIEQSGAGQDLVIQGFEVDFIADGYEEA